MGNLRCCKSKQRDEDNVDARSAGESQQMKQREKEESIRRNTKILREDLYQSYMKPYFKLGYQYKDFMKLFFQKEYYD